MPDSSFSLPNWTRFLGLPRVTAVLRAQPEDFRVRELPLITPAGEGSHLWLQVEKRGANTQWVADKLARAAGVPRRDVGYAGLKDRRGVTRQWFSVALQEAGNSDWVNWSIDEVHILEGVLHPRKLKRGALKGNRFRIVLRNLAGDLDDLELRLQKVAEKGVPNYFGAQRFGHGGLNVQRAVQWLERGGRLDRNKRSIYLSAVRSYLFNQVLDQRVRQGNWNRLVDGDVALLDGSRSIFTCSLPDPETERRCAEFDIHPTGPLPGRGGRVTVSGPAAVLEQEVLDARSNWLDALAAKGLEAARRSLRVRPAGFEWRRDGGDVSLEFDLPAGAYATSLVRELVSLDANTISE
jgi:tRNA pseudouridine13 synthase